jgi:multiple sugar transport system substrate-binding protein
VIEQLVSEFEMHNPGIKVKVTDLTWAGGHDKLVIAFAAHEPPDIVELGSDWVAEFASNGLLAELQSNAPSNYLYPATWNGKLYALPWLLDTRVLYFNLDLLQKAGMVTPGNWNELLTACRRIRELGEDYFGFGCNSPERHVLYKKFLPLLWSNGGRVLNDNAIESELDSHQATEALGYYLDLCACGLIESQRRVEEYFREGKIGFVTAGGWLLRRLRINPPAFRYELAEFHGPDGSQGTSFFGGEYLAVCGRTDRMEMAHKLVLFLTTKENSQRLCDAAGFGFPPYESLGIADPQKRIEADQLIHSASTPPTPIWVDIEQDIEDAIEAAIYGHGSARDVLMKASRTINDKLKSAEIASKE